MSLSLRYPVLSNVRKQLLLAVCIGLWLFLFLFFAEPFKIDRFSLTKKLIVLPLYGIIQSAIIAVALVYQRWVLRRGGVWKIRNEFGYHLVVALLAWGINYSFYLFFVTSGKNTYSFWDHARYHFFPALLIVLPVLAIVRFLAGFYGSDTQEATKPAVTFRGSGQQDYLKVAAHEVLYVAAEGNYVNVFYLEGNEIQSKLIRSKVTELPSTTALYRIHRSYLVNPTQIKSYRYKQKNLVVKLTNGQELPVARAKKKEVLALLMSSNAH